MEFQLPKPKNWQDFESICHELWRSIWGDMYAQKNGRQGQPQHGVDIFGRPSYASGIHAVQCKGKNDNYDTEITIEEIDDECKKATKFTPEISNYILATTKKKEVSLQKHCLKITKANTYKFPVNIWSWDDIEPEIQARPDLLKLHYQSFLDLVGPSNEYVIDLNTTQDKIAAFLTRPNIQQFMSHDLLQLVYPLIYELADNAFKYGKAGNFKVVFVNRAIELHDNGAPFDTRQLNDIEGRGGAHTLRFVKRELNNKIHHSYHFEKDKQENITIFEFSDDVLFAQLSDKFEITLEPDQNMGRIAGARAAEGQFISIPAYKKHIIINVIVKLNLTISFGEAYFLEVCKNLKPGQDVKAYLPANMIDVETLKESLKGYPIEIIVR